MASYEEQLDLVARLRPKVLPNAVYASVRCRDAFASRVPVAAVLILDAEFYVHSPPQSFQINTRNPDPCFKSSNSQAVRPSENSPKASNYVCHSARPWRLSYLSFYMFYKRSGLTKLVPEDRPSLNHLKADCEETFHRGSKVSVRLRLMSMLPMWL
jgi:hypothetical protein